MSRGDVLLLPGFMDGPDTPWWRVTSEYLEDSKYKPFFIDDIGQYETMNLKVPALGEIVLDYLEEHSKELSGIIGHSKGGITARYLVENEYLEPEWVVSIASPNKGSSMAEIPGFLDGTGCIAKGECIDDINKNGPNPDVRFLNIRSEHDTWVRAHESKPPNEEYAEVWSDLVISKKQSDIPEHAASYLQNLSSLDFQGAIDDATQIGAHITEHHIGMFYEDELHEAIADFTDIEADKSPTYFEPQDFVGLAFTFISLPGAVLSTDRKTRDAKVKL